MRKIFCLLCLSAALLPAISKADVLVRSGEKIAFLGDSITQQGASVPSGYCNLVISGLEANGVHCTPIYAGISGHKSNDMLARVDRDVIDKKPDWMTLSCGVNDVWHGARGVPLDQYKKNISEILDKCQAAHIKVLILTSTMIGEDAPNENNKKLAAYNDFLRETAAQRKLPIADLNAEMQEMLKLPPGAEPRHEKLLTVDGVHMNLHGNIMMATGVLKGFGLDDAEIQKAHEHWLDLPDSGDINAHISLTIRENERLAKLAASEHKSVQDLINGEVHKGVEELLKSAPAEGK